MQTRYLLPLVLLVFLVCGTLYAWATPPFEMPDESSHMTLVRYYRLNRALPPMVIGAPMDSAGNVAEAFGYHDPPTYYAPPLYYTLGALLTVPIGSMEDLPDLLVVSPRWRMGWGVQPNPLQREVNYYAHRFGQETWKASSTIRVLYVLRGASLILGVVTLLATYWAARSLWPGRQWLALGAMAIPALTPQFAATSAAVTNDALINVLFALFFAWGLALRRRSRRWGWLSLGVLVGFGLLTKQSALMLLPLGVLMICWRDGSWRQRLGDTAVFVATALALGAWWYVRNGLLYGDPLGFDPHFQPQVSLPSFPNLAGLTDSYYAAFGWTKIFVEPAVYWLVRLVILVGVVGIVRSLRRGESDHAYRELAILATAFALNVTLLIRWILATGPSLGRLLYPSAAPIALLLSWGWAQWARWRAGRVACGLVLLAALAFALTVPWRYLRPAFRSPLLARLPEQAQAVGVDFANGVGLAGFVSNPMPGAELRPGDTIHVTLYWRANETPTQDYFTWVQLGPDGGFPPLAKAHTWAGSTLYPTSLWQPGDVVRQDVTLTVPDEPEVTGRMWVRAGFVEGEKRVGLSDGAAPPEGSWDGREQAAIFGPHYVAGQEVADETTGLSEAGG